MKKSVLFQPIGRQPPKDTANQQQGRHAPLFSYPATRDARIKFWDFGRTGIMDMTTEADIPIARKQNRNMTLYISNGPG